MSLDGRLGDIEGAYAIPSAQYSCQGLAVQGMIGHQSDVTVSHDNLRAIGEHVAGSKQQRRRERRRWIAILANYAYRGFPDLRITYLGRYRRPGSRLRRHRRDIARQCNERQIGYSVIWHRDLASDIERSFFGD